MNEKTTIDGVSIHVAMSAMKISSTTGCMNQVISWSALLNYFVKNQEYLLIKKIIDQKSKDLINILQNKNFNCLKKHINS